MITNENTPAPAPVKKAAPKKTPPVKKARAPRTVDPAVAAIRAECRARIKALEGSVVSNKILQAIIAKRLPQLTQDHRQALFDELAKTCTPFLPLKGDTSTE